MDHGLPPDVDARDRAVTDVMQEYLDVALAEPAVTSLVTFGLSDRYTWLEEGYPRDDGKTRRPLPFDERLKPKPAFEALQEGLEQAPVRDQVWVPPVLKRARLVLWPSKVM